MSEKNRTIFDLTTLDLPSSVGGQSTAEPADSLAPKVPLSSTTHPDVLDLPEPKPIRASGFKTPPPPTYGQSFASPELNSPAFARYEAPSSVWAGLDLETLDLEPVGNQLQPASLDLESAGSDFLQPAEAGIQLADLNLQPADLDIEPVNLELEPVARNPKQVLDPAATHVVGVPRAPHPRALEPNKRGISRGLLYVGAAIVLLGLGAGVYYTNITDEHDVHAYSQLQEVEGDPKTGPVISDTDAIDNSIPKEGIDDSIDAEVIGSSLLRGGVEGSVQVEILYARAELLLRQNEPEAALVVIDEAMMMTIDLTTNDVRPYMLMTQAFLELGDYTKALMSVNQAQPSSPNAELHLLRGKTLEFNGRHKDARLEYLTALNIDANMHEARFLYGRLLAYDGVSGQAEVELSRVVASTDDRFPEAWLNLGRAQRDLGENDDAVKSLARATALDPTLREGFYLEGRIHADRNKHEKAIELFQSALAGDPETDQQWWIQAWADLGRVQVKAGQTAAAVASFKKFLELVPAGHSSRADASRQLRRLVK